MSRNQEIANRADAILASDPTLASWERKPNRVARALRIAGHALYVITIGV